MRQSFSRGLLLKIEVAIIRVINLFVLDDKCASAEKLFEKGLCAYFPGRQDNWDLWVEMPI
jgi:hypothetical protein